MKNLENYGVQEMNAMEIRETDGGLPWYAIIGIALMVESAIDGMIDGINDAAYGNQG